jgi:hypothetical protein
VILNAAYSAMQIGCSAAGKATPNGSVLFSKQSLMRLVAHPVTHENRIFAYFSHLCESGLQPGHFSPDIAAEAAIHRKFIFNHI